MRFETKRLIVRPVRESDAPGYLRLAEQFDSSPYAHTDHPWPLDADGCRQMAAWFAGEPRFCSICLREDAAFVGFISFSQDLDDIGRCDIGYRFDSDYAGQGYATEACAAPIDDAFWNGSIDRVEADTALENTPSVAMLKRLGFVLTSEHIASFREDGAGQPIRFRAGKFVLTREAWEGGPFFHDKHPDAAPST